DDQGRPQWESADATLWWAHALAALWSLGLAEGGSRAEELQARFGATLEQALESIQAGRHRHLRLASDGLLEVTSPHATWMDARVGGVAVTPRLGRLPEINALW